MALFKDLFKRSNVEDESDEMDAEIDDVYYGGHSEEKENNARRDDTYSDRRAPYEDRYEARSGSDDGYYDPDSRRAKSGRQDNDFYSEPKYNDRRNDDMFVEPVYNGRRDDDYLDLPFRSRNDVMAEEEPVTVEEPEDTAPVNAGTLYFLPDSYMEDRESIAFGLRDDHVVVIGVSRLDKAGVVRLYDFISGLAMALDADLFRLDPTTVVLVPCGVEIDENELEIPEELDEDNDTDEDEA